MKRGFILGLTTGVVLTGASFVLANSQIQAILNDSIKVALNGQVQEFKDETTNETQYPITYKDRTYLPLRTVANLVGVDVDYDAGSNTADLTKTQNDSDEINELNQDVEDRRVLLQEVDIDKDDRFDYKMGVAFDDGSLYSILIDNEETYHMYNDFKSVSDIIKYISDNNLVADKTRENEVEEVKKYIESIDGSTNIKSHELIKVSAWKSNNEKIDLYLESELNKENESESAQKIREIVGY